MSAATHERDWHFLDFFCDDENSCALTVFAGGKRFHIIADAAKLDKSSETVQYYHKLVQLYRSRQHEENDGEGRKDRSAEADSAVDLSHDQQEKDDKLLNKDIKNRDPEELLLTWMLEPLTSKFQDLSSSRRRSHRQTVQEWYKDPTAFYELAVQSSKDELQAVELESEDDLEQRMQNLLPEMPLPKYIGETIKAPIYKASDLSVLHASDQPPGTPYHPCRVSIKDKHTYFLKIIDKSQPQAIKRELQILNQVSKEGLNKKIKVPVLEGLVCFDDAEDTSAGQRRIMGFLQTDIPDAKPLTDMLDASVPQSKRERWADEAEKLKNTLHKHDIIWGDAKADNLMVDANDDLWIIDFGGSYTEGWVEHDMKETKEGDHMGTEKTVNALIDPVNNTCDPEAGEDDDVDEEDDGKSETCETGKTGKRKAHTNVEEDDTVDEISSKRRKRSG